MKILHIVPRLPPTITGVGDYAYLLARELRGEHRIQTHFLVCDPSWQGDGELDGFVVERLQARSSEELQERLSAVSSPPIVLLHYVGYGYENRGCPQWLVKGLERWKESGHRRRLIIMFHELFAFGPPWRSSFWTYYIQQRLVIRLVRLAYKWVTNMRRYAEWLAIKSGIDSNRVITLPVFSTIGERVVNTPLARRAPRAVIFGNPTWVNELLGRYLEDTIACCRALGLEEIVTVGSPVGTVRQSLPIPVIEQGYLSADQIIDLLGSSRTGFMNYFPGYLAKSSVYAAYSALGILPVLPRANPSNLDGCRAGETYLLSGRIKSSLAEEMLQRVTDNAGDWYRTHNLSCTASTYAELLRECAQAC